MKRLAIVCTHPIQYYAPVFRLLAERAKVQLKVFYTWGNSAQAQYDPGFGKTISWDIPLLEGYESVFVPNTSKNPGSHHFWGIVNPSLLQDVLAWRPDAVLIYGWNYHSHLRLLWGLQGRVPVWFRGDSNLLDPQPRWKALLKKMVLRQVYRLVDRAFYVGTANKEYYQAYGLQEQQLVFAPHAIDNGRFADSPERQYQTLADQWRNSLGIDPQATLVLFVGKLEPKKNPALLLQVIQEYNTRHSQALQLLFVGNGVLEESLKASAAGDSNVFFLDFQNQGKMPLVYRLGQLFCLPSRGPGETWGLAVNEALACNRPVLVSERVGCAIDLVQEGSSGLIFQHNNATDLLRCIQQMEQDLRKGKYEQVQTGIENWSFEQQVLAFEQTLSPS